MNNLHAKISGVILALHFHTSTLKSGVTEVKYVEK